MDRDHDDEYDGFGKYDRSTEYRMAMADEEIRRDIARNKRRAWFRKWFGRTSEDVIGSVFALVGAAFMIAAALGVVWAVFMLLKDLFT